VHQRDHTSLGVSRFHELRHLSQFSPTTNFCATRTCDSACCRAATAALSYTAGRRRQSFYCGIENNVQSFVLNIKRRVRGKPQHQFPLGILIKTRRICRTPTKINLRGNSMSAEKKRSKGSREYWLGSVESAELADRGWLRTENSTLAQSQESSREIAEAMQVSPALRRVYPFWTTPTASKTLASARQIGSDF